MLAFDRHVVPTICAKDVSCTASGNVMALAFAMLQEYGAAGARTRIFGINNPPLSQNIFYHSFVTN
jgi:hypothetical protein